MSTVALVATLSACSTSNTGDRDSAGAAGHDPGSKAVPVVTEVPRLVASTDLLLPLDRYRPSMHDLERYGIARRELLRRCMLRFGVDADLPEPVTGVGPRTWTERRYGLTDAGEAATLGYGLGEREPGDHRRDTDAPLSPRALALLTGEGAALPRQWQVPPGGCSGEAERALAGDQSTSGQPVDMYLAQQLSQESFERSRRDPRVRDAFGDWSACMRREGHRYADPLAPFADRSMQHGPTPKAIDTAVDDVACKQRTNLVGTWYAVESAYQTVLVNEHKAELDAVAAANAATRDVVARVFAEGSRH